MARVLPKISSRRVPPKRGVGQRSEPALGLRLLGLQPRLEPHELFEFEYRVRRVKAEAVDRVEISVAWQTEGKGSEDMGVHLFRSLSGDDAGKILDGRPQVVVTTLPGSPLSYSGQILSIKWCVRLRVYLQDGREFTCEKPFELGHLSFEV